MLIKNIAWKNKKLKIKYGEFFGHNPLVLGKGTWQSIIKTKVSKIWLKMVPSKSCSSVTKKKKTQVLPNDFHICFVIIRKLFVI